ncbi:MAG: pilin [Patescibacteria group bacterium]|jgi:hypothetical protein
MGISKKHILSFISLTIFSLLVCVTYLPFRTNVQAASDSLINSQEGMTEIGSVYGGSEPTDIRVTVAKIIVVSLQFIGVIFLGLIIFAGFKYMTSGGNEEKTKEAVSLLSNAIIGLIIILMAWGITSYVINRLSRAASGAIWLGP